MNRQAFQQFMEAKQFKVYGMNAFGMIGDYPVNVIYAGSKLWNFVFAVDLTDAKQQIKELRKENKKKYTFMQSNTGLTISATIKDKQAEEDFDTAARELISILHQKGIRPTRTCAFCKQGDCDVLVANGNGYVPAHRHCVENATAQVVHKAQNSDMNGNYVTGVIGAILGAIVGTLPSLFTILTIEKIYALLFALIPLCIYGGYKLLKGKMNKFVIVITIILSVFSVFLIQYELILFYLMSEYELAIGEAFTFLIEMLGMAETWKSTIQENIMSFIFVGLGIWIAWGQITKTSASEVQDAEAVKRTMVPYGDDRNNMM